MTDQLVTQVNDHLPAKYPRVSHIEHTSIGWIAHMDDKRLLHLGAVQFSVPFRLDRPAWRYIVPIIVYLIDNGVEWTPTNDETTG